jgi:putative acetyltransferase
MNSLRALVRTENTEDYEAVRRLNESAFDTPAEAGLVDLLRQQAAPFVSLVADDGGEIVGHILFSPVELSGARDLVMGLAPMAVAPARQRDGIGSALVQAGLDECRKLGATAVIVLGHPEYYPRFGFVPASNFSVDCEYEVPDGVFMAMELEDDSLAGAGGTAKYHPAFGTL